MSVLCFVFGLEENLLSAVVELIFFISQDWLACQAPFKGLTAESG